MIKRFIVICITIIGSAAFAQQGTSSPYSFYGIGSLKFKGTVENQSMGGIGVYLDSIHFNLKNPASYAGNPLKGPYFNGESRPVKFTVAGTMTNTTLKSNSGDAKTNNAIFDYLAVSVPMGKFGVGFGLLPFTSVGYKLDLINDDNVLENRFNGEGGLNRVFAGVGYQITEKLSVGMDINYNFGNIQNNALEVEYSNGQVVQYQTVEFNRSDLSGLNLNFGLSYKTMITDKLELSTTATFAPGSKLNSDNVRSFSTVTLDATTLETSSTSNTIDVDLEAQNLKNTKLTLPSTLSLGVGVGDPKSWFVGTEYTYQTASDFSNPVFPNLPSNYENSSKIAVGGFYIPDYNAFSGYFKRAVYRAGFNFSNTGLVIKDESIKEFGMSFGLGLPVGNRNLFSNANLGLEFGKRGTTNKNLIQENFISFNVSLSLNSRWFEQRKYN
ncbi:hypothetical protein ITJ86_01585 [Winogradskyella sp. F6397]|uniref:Long-chain fatty acid transport protein n=1 Tax=Winogradskyella marina TaxID=2785530 RepID=A0ABS0EDP6_9FLAO|nr:MULTISPECIES: hypothetical protein [Winogradskyella]MBF8148568.1 hypothetical protein [Winogradskyella marina]